MKKRLKNLLVFLPFQICYSVVVFPVVALFHYVLDIEWSTVLLVTIFAPLVYTVVFLILQKVLVFGFRKIAG